MPKFRLRQTSTFLIVLTACAAFLVGIVKIWGVPADRLVSSLIMIFVMLAGLILLALAVVVVLKLIAGKKDE